MVVQVEVRPCASPSTVEARLMVGRECVASAFMQAKAADEPDSAFLRRVLARLVARVVEGEAR